MQVTSSLKEQYKLLLEQKAIMYVYPGDSSPTTREGAWQIVMNVHSRHKAASGNDARQSNSSDPASDSSQLEEDVFAPPDSEEIAPSTQTVPVAKSVPVSSENITPTPPSPPPAPGPGPPSYNECATRYQQQQLPINSFDGILPATRARLASLKSLGSKKLQAIKMRLSDQRQKNDECT